MKKNRRLLWQFGFFFVQNPFLKNFFTGEIYRGGLKHICTPGLNCYSCPAAALSCPLGALQLFFAGAVHNVSLYVTGFLISVGVVFGRFICGFLCPMGLLSDLLYRIGTPKLILRLRFLRYVKYIILLLFVIILPSVVRHTVSGLGRPWFCAYICPSGTIFGAVPLMAANDFLRELAGVQFILKISMAGAVVFVSVFVLRVFCRVLCPLGAVYGLLNKVAAIHIRHNGDKCTKCGRCAKACHIALDPVRESDSPECFRCGRCVTACPAGSFSVCRSRDVVFASDKKG